MALFPAVIAGQELERVFSLARRPIPDPAAPENVALARELTARLRRVPIPYPFRSPADHLYATQALALKEFYENRGLIAPIKAGSGKSLLCYLAVAVMQPKRPMLVVPASMLVDTEVEWRRFERDWRGPRFDDLTLLSYEKISNPSSGAKTLPDGTEIYGDILERHRPDMIVCDEVHRLGEVSSAGTRRIGRYIHAEKPVFLGCSGTLLRRSLKDGAHILEFALWDRSPLPLQWEELQAWSDACDARPNVKGKRTDYGALLEHLSPEERTAFDETDDPDDARGTVVSMLGRRLLETPGIIGSQDGPLLIPARIDPLYVADPDDAIEDEYRKLLEGEEDSNRAAWTLPDGTVLADSLALARPLTTLGLSFYLLQDPRPPEEYRVAASAWASAVRETIRYRPHLKLDSEWMVRDAVQRGGLPELEGILSSWLEAQRDYRAKTGHREPPSVATWVSDEIVGEVERWLGHGAGLVWVSFVALGERLSKELRIPYFGSGKTDGKGRHVTKLKRGEPAVVSIASVGTGTNGMQYCHHRNLWLGAPSEQSLARTHRPGQEAECVVNDVFLGASQHLSRFWRAVKTAECFAGAVSRQAQRLSYFQSTMPKSLELEGRRWGSSVAVDSAGEDA